MTFRVDVSAFLMSKVSERFGATRSVEGAPSGYDFIGGPLSAALVEIADFADDPDYWDVIRSDPTG